MADRQWETFHGLNRILENRQWSISKSCQAVELCLDTNRDNLRGFFEQCFSLLLKQIFGYDGSSWLNSIAKGGSDADAKALVGLLSPTGQLVQAMHSADADGLIKFEFPLNRLPTHTQQLIRLAAGRKELERWPQYRQHILVDARGGCHVHLNVFEYFVFWTAFYVLKSSQVADSYAPSGQHRGYGHLAPLGSVRKALGVNRDRPHAQRHPYLRLLRMYLEHYLPRTAPSKPLPSPRVMQSPSRQRLAEAVRAARGQVLLSVLVEFWLTDGDEPVPPTQQGNQHLTDTWGQAITARVRTFQPSSEDLIEALTVLVRFVTVVEGSDQRRPSPAQGSAAWLPTTPSDQAQPLQVRAMAVAHAPLRLGAHASAPTQAFSRRLFRFLRRSLTLWPEQQPLTPVVHLWLSVLAPWCSPDSANQPQTPPVQGTPPPPTSLARYFARAPTAPGNTPSAQKDAASRRPDSDGSSAMDPSEWTNHVLSNLPFYTSLLPLFLDLLRTRVSSRGDAALSDLIKVMRVLKAAPPLLTLLRTVEADLARFTSQAGRRPEGMHADLLPFLCEQAQDWEAAASSGQAVPSAAQALGEVRLFGTDERSAAFKTRDLLNAATGAAREELLAEARALVAAVLPLDQLPDTGPSAAPRASQQLEPVQGLRRGTWEQTQYKGDWMRRPLASNEIGWLVRLLLKASDYVNMRCGLDQPPPPEAGRFSYNVQSLGIWLRSRGWKVNLRPLGEMQTLAWIPPALFVWWLLWRLLLVIVTTIFRSASAAVHIG